MAFVLAHLHLELVFADTTATGGDMGAHVWGPAYLRDHLLPQGRVTGWTPDWYLGFPAYHFYFPLPSLLVVGLDLAGLPYNVAFKLVTIVGVGSLPVSAWAFGRLTRLPFPAPPLLAVATVPFLFDRFHTIWGGNLAATLAGEFAFSIALSLALLFLGVLTRALRTGRHGALAAVLLGATALTHLLPAAFAAVGALVVLACHARHRRTWLFAVAIGGAGTAIAGFWLLPFLARLPYSNDMGWERTNTYLEHLLPYLRTDVSRGLTQHFTVVAPLALLGAVLAAIRRRGAGLALAGTTLMMGLGFVALPAGAIWNARLLPFWYLGLYLLAAVGVAEVIHLVTGWISAAPGRAPFPSNGDRRPLPDGSLSTGLRSAGAGVAAVAVLMVVAAPLGRLPSSMVTVSEPSFVQYWAEWNYSGYERKPAYGEYHDVITTMGSLGQTQGCGRAMWEYESELNRFGTPMGLMLLPYWTDGCIGSMEGLFFESSATVPYHFLLQSEVSTAPSSAMRDLPYRPLDLARGVAHMRLLGVKYYLATSPGAQAQARAQAGLRLLATTQPRPVQYDTGLEDRSWEVYEVVGAALVEPLEHQPVVATDGLSGKEGWLEAAVAWFQDEQRWDVPLATGGPPDWLRVPDPEVATTVAPQRLQPVEVRNIRSTGDRISFDVDRPGVPVVVNASYFPNWKTSGAQGPWRITPNLMVVVPTATSVELHYGRTPIDIAALVLTLLGLAGALALGWLWPRQSWQEPEPTSPVDEPLKPLDEPLEPLAVGSSTQGEPLPVGSTPQDRHP
ncbi:MAG: hypothetical protein AVDCRST_MAG50-2142 [uncultured Acidimicrobiales bacterium]|uniref:Membrane protein 6-pyruvoyl-tetrahydropterin synthase-related domain-containing protein n=1 Tax=uncultured Acidimicrobiales bacterium TaxID=310071 RepID=A0A6J4I0W7_9ACTN|nr:MAG: hypothetical protein AVDCRST_MAG50-2142 [uncultured Acidimicrobiales bacterium]